VVNNTYDGKLS